MEKIYVNQEGLVMIVSKEDKPVNPIANFVEFCPLQCREKGVFFMNVERENSTFQNRDERSFITCIK